jgi:hypothetical protein
MNIHRYFGQEGKRNVKGVRSEQVNCLRGEN